MSLFTVSALTSALVLASMAAFPAIANQTDGSLNYQQQRINFDISTVSFKEALTQFSHVAGVQLFVKDEAVIGLSTQSLKGQYQAAVALDILLDNTGLIAVWKSPNAVIVKEKLAKQTIEAETGLITNDDAVVKNTLETIVITTDRPRSFAANYVQAGTFRNSRVLDTALTTSILTKELLEAQQASSLADAVRNTAGVSYAQINTAIYSNLAIRGIRLENNTNYRLNGVLPLSNYIQMPLENKDRVEVLKGASGLYYGFGSPSGVINLVTERAYENKVTAEAFASNHGSLGVNVDIEKTFDNSGVRINLVTANEDLGVDRSSGDRHFASIGYDLSLSESLRFEFDGEYISRDITEQTEYYLLANSDGEITLPPLLEPSTNHGAEWFKAEAESYNLLGSLTYDFSEFWQGTFAAGRSYSINTRRYSSFYGFDIDSGSGGKVALSTFPETEYDNKVVDIKLSGGFNTGDIFHQVIAGGSLNTSNAVIPEKVKQGAWSQDLYHPENIAAVDTPQRTVKNEIDKEQKGLYLATHSQITQWLALTLGYRYTDYKNESFTSDYYDKIGSLSGSILIQPTENLTLYASYIEGLEEGGLAQGIAKNAGEVLPAAVSEQQEVGLKYQSEQGLFFTAAYFDIDRVSAFIDPVTNYFVQDGRAVYQGVEVSASGELTDNLSLMVNATYIHAQQEKTSSELLTSKRIENTPEHTASVFIKYNMPSIEGLSVTAGAFYTGDRAVDALNSAFADSYTLFDIGANYQTMLLNHQVEFSLYGQNITNEKYWAATGSRLLAQGLPGTIKLTMSIQF
ncbi:TonB-dependent receptor [Colwellia sp. D2M02]|uniref:TonB-dependent siderophore receptor n=1 Tax=Colwellia sp. D2M02 TaxID=2841562 RepID=UPI001C0996E7|nr:TonB-dependent receptor [Colwellia sp. D2M02]MBU2892030.1 TonB-dependent receptor [Colwellia sp. D2M02]